MNYFLIVQEKFNFFYKKLHFSIIFQSFGLKNGTFSNSLLTVFGLFARCSQMVRLTGLEPARREHQILSLARLPIPPQALLLGLDVLDRLDVLEFLRAKVSIYFHSAKSFLANSISVSLPFAKSSSVCPTE